MSRNIKKHGTGRKTPCPCSLNLSAHFRVPIGHELAVSGKPPTASQCGSRCGSTCGGHGSHWRCKAWECEPHPSPFWEVTTDRYSLWNSLHIGNLRCHRFLRQHICRVLRHQVPTARQEGMFDAVLTLSRVLLPISCGLSAPASSEAETHHRRVGARSLWLQVGYALADGCDDLSFGEKYCFLKKEQKTPIHGKYTRTAAFAPH